MHLSNIPNRRCEGNHVSQTAQFWNDDLEPPNLLAISWAFYRAGCWLHILAVALNHDNVLTVATVLQATRAPFLLPCLKIFVGGGIRQKDVDSLRLFVVDGVKLLRYSVVCAGKSKVVKVCARAVARRWLLCALAQFSDARECRAVCGQSYDRHY